VSEELFASAALVVLRSDEASAFNAHLSSLSLESCTKPALLTAGHLLIGAGNTAVLCIHHPAAGSDDVEWWRALVVCTPVPEESAEPLRELAAYRFDDDHSPPLGKVFGESLIMERGNKMQTGTMLCYGYRPRYSPTRYGANNPHDLRTSDLADAHVQMLSGLERKLTPALANRRALVFRESSATQLCKGCNAYLCSVTSGYAVEPHTDNAMVNETILFAPHECGQSSDWFFYAGGLLLTLRRPTFVTVRLLLDHRPSHPYTHPTD
jgi:hypothetical protein